MQIRPRTRRLAGVLTAALAALTAVATGLPAQANPDHVDPASLDRGAAPRVAYLVGNTIHDGDRRLRAPRAEMHLDLWTSARGYVVTDQVANEERRFRITSITKTGERKVLARLSWLEGSAMSPRGTRMAWGEVKGQDVDAPVVVTVVDPHTGAVKARRSFDRAEVIAVTGSRVLLTKPGYRRVIKTWWWDYRSNTQRKISDQYARRADVRHDRIVFAPGSGVPHCNRVARLSRPGITLWRDCTITPHAWSPNGERALATNIYFDVPGTDRWVVVDGRTGKKGSRVNGRLDWDVTWESNRHFLTMAQGDDGSAAIIRCTTSGSCERASRIWDLEIDPDYYYVAPPVLLASNN